MQSQQIDAGVPGAFAHQALHEYFGDVKNVNYEHFQDVYEALKNDEIDYGIVPLENSSTGAINDNYDLVRIKSQAYSTNSLSTTRSAFFLITAFSRCG